jgi:hypothetical protein
MDRQWTVAASAGLLSLENVAVLAGLIFRHAPAGVLVLLMVKFPLCVALLRLRLAAAVALILWESVTMGAALVNTSIAPPAQLLLFASAVAGSTLLALSLPLYVPARREG